MTKKVDDFIVNIIDWHYDRNLIDGSTDKDQYMKLVQEFGELASNYITGPVEDDIGDCFVVALNILERNNLTLVNVLSNHMACKCDILEVTSNIQTLATSGITAEFNQAVRYLGLLSDDICKKKDFQKNLAFFCIRLLKIANIRSVSFRSCLAQAWNDIKDRKGKMIDGVFVKEADLTQV